MKTTIKLEPTAFPVSSLGANLEKHGEEKIVIVKVLNGTITVPADFLKNLSETHGQKTLFTSKGEPRNDVKNLEYGHVFKDHGVIFTADRQGDVVKLSTVAKKIQKFKIKEYHEGNYITLEIQLQIERGGRDHAYDVEDLAIDDHFLEIVPPELKPSAQVDIED